MEHIKAIYFDLDDTLWNMEHVIPRAEQHLYAWFAEHYPRVTEVFTQAKLQQLRNQTGARYPELRHDLGRLRMTMLRQVLRESGYSEAHASAAFEVFQQARNRVTLYADVLPALDQLASTHRLFALTNGNASLAVIGIHDKFEACLTARELGAAKPDTAFFERALRQTSLQAENVLHVGDHPENDIRAAAAAGLTTLWLNRNQASWPLTDSRPDRELQTLEQLPAMLL